MALKSTLSTMEQKNCHQKGKSSEKITKNAGKNTMKSTHDR